MKIKLLIFLFFQIFSLKFYGIDVSESQGNIDWKKLEGKKHFAIIRAGIGSEKDSNWETNYKGAKSANLNKGAYWYAKADSVEDAKDEAKSFIKALANKKLEWPVYYYIDKQSIFDAKLQDSIAKAFCDILSGYNYYCGIYSSEYNLKNYFNSETKKKYTIWLSKLNVTMPSYNGEYQVWQKSKETVEGISGEVYIDEGNSNFEPYMKERHLNGY